MADEPIVEQAAPIEAAPPAAPAEVDPFALDEAKFASLSPEQRASLDPVLSEWKEKAKGELTKVRESYKPAEERARALEMLTQDQRFQAWYRSLSQPQQQQVNQQAQQQQRPQVASPEEWATAVQEAATGNPERMQNIYQRMMSEWARPTVEALESRQNQADLRMEMTDLFTSHTDAKELDRMGRDAKNPNDNRPSLLEICLHYVKDLRGGTMEQAYQVARQIADASGAKSQQAAMGMLQDKKASVTGGPSTSTQATDTVFVDSTEELLSKGIDALLNKQRTRFTVKR